MANIAIDLHGGDFGPSVLIPSSIEYFRKNPHHRGMLIGELSQCQKYSNISSLPNIEWIDSKALVEHARKPSQLLRQEGHSSIEIAFRLLRDKKVEAIVSSEHTGVLAVLTSKYGHLHPSLNRPVLASWLPTETSPTVFLDLGASFEATTDQLLAFAAIGLGLVGPKKLNPSLSLLNVGIEDFKGPQTIRAAYKVIKEWPSINFNGFVEADDLYKGLSDVIVCDGFTGNSVIKSSEGAAKLVFNLIKRNFDRNIVLNWAGSWVLKEITASLASLDPRSNNGAVLAGSNLLIVKSHGSSMEKAFSSAIKRAVEGVEKDYVKHIWSKLDYYLEGR